MISELNNATTLHVEDLIPVARGNTTLKLAGAALSAVMVDIARAQTATPSQNIVMPAGGVVTTSTLNATNNVVITSNTTNPALKVTQNGLGAALYVEDTSGDATPFVVDASGHVGIGTTAPSHPLDVFGDAVIRRSGDRDQNIYFVSDSNGNTITGQSRAGNQKALILDTDSDSQGIVLRTRGTSCMTILTSGQIGIGTTTPGGTLHAYANSDAPAVKITQAGLTGTALYIEDQGSDASPFVIDKNGHLTVGIAPSLIAANTNTVWISGCDASPAAGLKITQSGTGYALYVEDSTTGDTSPFVINGAGNVGIGTTAPLFPLHMVSTNAQIARFDGRVPNSSGYVGMTVSHLSAALPTTLNNQHTFFDFAIGNVATASMHCHMFNSNVNGLSGYSDLSFYTSPDGTKAVDHRKERMRIDRNGNVGIGTTTPLANLNVYSAVSGGVLARFQSPLAYCYIADNNPNGVQMGINGLSSAYIDIGTAGSDYDLRMSSFYGNQPCVKAAAGKNLNLGAGGIEAAMTITSGGFVGIGTTSPNADLTVVGDISATGYIYGGNRLQLGNHTSSATTSPSARLIIASDKGINYIESGANALQGTAAPLVFSNMYDAIEWARFDATGKLGIGTTAPGSKLSVNSSSGGGLFDVASPTTKVGLIDDNNVKGPQLQISGLSGAYIDLSPTLSSTSIGAIGDYALRVGTFANTSTSTTLSTYPNSHPFIFAGSGLNLNLGAGNSRSNVTITSSGYVGIGTTAPAQELTIVGDVLANNFISTSNFILSANGTAIAGTRTGFFGTTITLAANKTYELEYHLYYKNENSSGTTVVNYALSSTQPFTYVNGNFMQDIGGATAVSTGTIVNSVGPIVDLGPTETLTALVSCYGVVRSIVSVGANNATVSLALSTNNASGIAPLKGSYRKVTQFSNN